MVKKHPYLQTRKPDAIKAYDILGFDVETQGPNNEFVMCAFTGDNLAQGSKVFWDQAEMRQWVLSRKWEGKILMATNTQFDVFAAFALSDIEYMDIVEDEGKVYGFTAYVKDQQFTKKKTKNKITFYDTTNYLPASVAQLGKIVGHPKMAAPSCLGKIPKNDSERLQLETYCINDAFVSMRFAQIIQEGINTEGGNLKMTAASCAMDLFLRKYLKNDILKPDFKQASIEQASYYGGRTEVFKRGRVTNANYYDVNSLYPSVMIKDLPCPNSRKTGMATLDKIKSHEGCSEVKVVAPDIKIPFLPYKYTVNNEEKLIFPVGTFSGTYTHTDLRYAMKLGYKITPTGDCVTFSNNKPYMRDYVQNLYKVRLEYKAEKNPLQTFYKLMMNGLYGKFGQKPRTNKKWISKQHVTLEQLEKNEYSVMKDFFLLDDCKPVLPNHVQPIWASYITSYARQKLYETLKEVDPIYCDTDSIVTTHKIESDQNKLGAWALEYEIVLGCFIKPKLYYMLGYDEDKKIVSKLKAKGVRQNGTDLETLRIIITKTPIEQERFIKLRRSQRSKSHHKSGVLQVNQIITEDKLLSLEDSKRYWEKEFVAYECQDSRPITINEDEKN